MFNLEQIDAAAVKVKTGADFPQYFKDISDLGVISFEVMVENGHEIYFGNENFKLQTPPKYDNLPLKMECNIEAFKKYLKIHQMGETDYPKFCEHAAETGILKWKIVIAENTCTYYNHKNEAVLTETILS